MQKLRQFWCRLRTGGEHAGIRITGRFSGQCKKCGAEVNLNPWK